MMHNILHHAKYYGLAVVTEAILLQSHFWEGVDEWIKRCTMIAGIAIALFTAIKLYQDIAGRTLDNKLKRLDIEKREEEVRRFFEDKYRQK